MNQIKPIMTGCKQTHDLQKKAFVSSLMFRTWASQRHGDGARIWWQAAHAIELPPHTLWLHPAGEVNCRVFTKRYPQGLKKNIYLLTRRLRWTGTQVRCWNGSSRWNPIRLRVQLKLQKFPNFKSPICHRCNNVQWTSCKMLQICHYMSLNLTDSLHLESICSVAF